ncbi:MAG: hypothetical protein ABEN55_09520 [Bradymonadaceae bacterium]
MRRDEKRRQDLIEKALLKAALEGEPFVAADTPVDTERARNAWDVQPVEGGADLFNDAPHAGILEKGSRPHRPPFKPILRWVVRNFGLNLEAVEARKEAENTEGTDPDEAAREAMQNARRSLKEDDPESASEGARSMAWAVVEHIEENGTEPNWMVRDNLPKLKALAQEAVEDFLAAGP